MKKNEAEQLVSQTFTKAFTEEKFVLFVRNLLPDLESSSTRIVQNAQLPQGFREHIYNYTRLGTYRDPQGDVLDVVIVKLKRRGSLDRARTRQRNLMAHYLNKRGKDAVLVAYITDDLADWRFSYVKLAYQTEVTNKGKVKVNQEFTPARRFSFLVGEHEPNHTAQKQLGDLLMQEGKLTLEQIEEAFNIESVTKEFFEDYKSLFLKIKENMDKIVNSNPKVKAEFERCEIETENFAKKLLGQIVFLYFLQKKGWLGVDKDQAWGTGDKKFLSNLFEKSKEQNFFDEILEPFFYEALAIERKGDFYPALKCKVPFLNGGLFEPLNGYDWDNTHIDLDNKVFEKIFDFFNRYNFTVREDEPLEKEVAVDPEMLGKVFENLLEITDRKSKGAFYTPREIVHYMCQESLINYLDTALNNDEPKVSKENIETFIREGDLSIERDQAREEGKLGDDDYGLPESIREHAKEIDYALADVKICDPAIGSGAFPVGMMTEIVRARNVLTTHISNKRNRDLYTFKWHCIENNLYGVDIDPSAVEIGKLRLWLSLVVDEESYDHIRPLPNLDYRIICGNSLLSVEKNLFNYSLYPELTKKKGQYFSTTSRRNKEVLRQEIDGIIQELTLGESIFDFEIFFNEVFHDKGGFDVVIGNPPYIGQKGNKDIFREVKDVSLGKRFHQRRMDFFYFFIHLSLDITKENGSISLITTNYYLTATYADKLRKDIKKRAVILKLINFNELKIFESALGQHNLISIFRKGDCGQVVTKSAFTHKAGNASSADLLNIFNWDDRKTNYYETRQNDLFEGDELFIRLSGIDTITSENPKKRILAKMMGQTKPLGEVSSIFQGLVTGGHKVSKKHIEKYSITAKLGDGLFILSTKEIEGKKFGGFEREFLKPWFKNSHIDRWITSKDSSENVIYITKKIPEARIPNIMKHFEKYKPFLIDRNVRTGKVSLDDYEKFLAGEIDIPYVMNKSAMREGRYYGVSYPRQGEWFEGEKIIAPQRSPKNTFGYNDFPWYASTDVYFIIAKENFNQIKIKYFLGILNSKLIYLWLYEKGQRKGENLELFATPLSRIPIKIATPVKQAEIIEIVDQILFYKNMDGKSDIKELEAKIDEIVFQIYGLTEEEIAVVEESVGR
jgi:hypothetical protein